MAAATFLEQTLIEANDPKNALIFKKMQGNILKGHGRDHATVILIKFKGRNKERARKILADFAKGHVTSFYKQLWERERFKRNNIPGDTFGGIFISQRGYDFIETKCDLLEDDAFKDGMKARSVLNDPAVNVDNWHKKEIHAMLLLADDDVSRMNRKARELLDALEKSAEIIHVEYGDAIRNANGDGLEHNGYVDGISQPLFLKDEVDEYIKDHQIIDEQFSFDPRAKPELVLINDPYVKSDVLSFGSYFVLRKLEQNVKAFKGQEALIGKRIYPEEKFTERVGARIVGRFEDGTPVQLQGEDQLIGSGTFNNFNYEDTPIDPSGGRCPHFAHIRKTNPRTNNKFDNHTMARRGIPFGHRNVATEQEELNHHQFPESGIGLLFMSYQRSIVNQFEFIQLAANSKSPGNVDPVIGQNELRDQYDFPADGETSHGNVLSNAFDQHIFFKGGEYFFAPSITYLESL